MSSESRYKILGQGTFGMVVEPALPNKDKANFPGKVTKIMSNYGNYKSTLRTSRKIKQSVPELHIPVNEYKMKPYRLNNINNAALKGKVRNFLERAHGEGANTFYPLRMNSLGDSFGDIGNKKDLSSRLEAIPHEILCQQVLKLMNVVKAIKDAGYVHADIRETNVLMNLATQTMTIIDFDWFRSFDEYVNEYPVYFYSHPPEELFYIQFDVPAHTKMQYTYPGINTFAALVFQGSRLPPEQKEELINTIFKRLVTDEVKKAFKYIRIPYPSMEDVIDGSIQFVRDMMEKASFLQSAQALEMEVINAWEKSTLPTVDSYGLGLSLFYLLRDALKEGTAIETFFLEELIPGMCASYVKDRFTIEEGIQMLKSFMRKQGYKGTGDAVMDSLADEFSRLTLVNSVVKGQSIAGKSVSAASKRGATKKSNQSSLKAAVTALANATKLAEATALPNLPKSGTPSPIEGVTNTIASPVLPVPPPFKAESAKKTLRRSERLRKKRESKKA